VDLSTVLPGILLLGIVIFFHELGHFIAAKWRGVTVIKFSLGMGPEMIGFSAGGTRYCFSWIHSVVSSRWPATAPTKTARSPRAVRNSS
jgi:membrane-associated protease RseP (regulator of RpoE activity)